MERLITTLANLVRPAGAVNPGHAACLFVPLQIYFASNALSFGFWKSGEGVFRYMLGYFGAWVAGLVLVLWLFLTAGRRFNRSWLGLAGLVVLSTPFAWDLWIQSIQIDTDAIRRTARILLLPAMYLYFRIGLEHVRRTGCAVLLLCVLSFSGHAGLSISTGPPPEFDTVKMDRKPNVHVIMLDSFTHSAFSKEFMGIENPAADFLATLEDAIYSGRMGFAEYVPTKQSWGALFNLGERNRYAGFFSGSAPSRPTVLLRENGYSITTGFSGDYFGWDRGEYVDHYYRGKPQNLSRGLVCTSKKGLLGFCDEFSRTMYSRYFALESEDMHERQIRKRKWPETVLDLIDRMERAATRPLFTAFHIYSPIGHTPLNYRSDDAEQFTEFKQYFVDGLQRARQVLEKINRLRNRYPESIFVVSGDHGPWLSRTAPKEDRRFIVLDRHAVALALLNASNLCPWSRDWLSRQRYLTPSRILAASLACNGASRRLTDHFTDNEEFIRFGESFSIGKS